jgi:hypothetical protein
MIRWLVKLIFGKQIKRERQKIAEEARKVLSDAKEYAELVRNKIYINYRRVSIESDEFLYGIESVYKNRCFISWLNDHKIQWQHLQKLAVDKGDKDAALLCAVKMSLVDDLFNELKEFEFRYQEMLNQKAEGQNGGQEQR